jgi:hypothetical protein
MHQVDQQFKLAPLYVGFTLLDPFFGGEVRVV